MPGKLRGIQPGGGRVPLDHQGHGLGRERGASLPVAID
jgi:hypothetical protein